MNKKDTEKLEKLSMAKAISLSKNTSTFILVF